MRTVHQNDPQSNPRTPAQARVFAPLGVVTARAAHATPETVVTRRRHLCIIEEGARNVAEDEPAFVFSRGRKIVAGVNAPASAIDALRRHARTAESEQPRVPWQGRKAA